MERLKHVNVKCIREGGKYLLAQFTYNITDAAIVGRHELGQKAVKIIYRAEVLQKLGRFMLVRVIPAWTFLDGTSYKPCGSYNQTINYIDVDREAFFFEEPVGIDYLTREELHDELNWFFRYFPVREYVS